MTDHFKLMPAIVIAAALMGTGCDAQGPSTGTPASETSAGNTSDANPHSADKEPAAKPPAEGSLRMNINTATLTDLETIPGVGTALAKLIVAGRPYASVDELEKVAGIGPKSLKELRPYVKVDGEIEKLR
jgi:DNA uptake protein ComE-like DNA-binding protein